MSTEPNRFAEKQAAEIRSAIHSSMLVVFFVFLLGVMGCSDDAGTGPKEDKIPPSIATLSAATMYELVVTFDEKITSQGAEDESNYSVSSTQRADTVSVLLALLEGDSFSVWLETSRQDTVQYSLTVRNVEDVSGNSIGTTGVSMEFTGSSTEDTISPRVLSTYPANQETGVPVHVAVEVCFDERMNTASVESLLAMQELGVPLAISGDFSWDVPHRGVVFEPEDPLKPLTSYNVSLSGEVRDAHGVRMMQDLAVFFETGIEGATAVVSGEIAKHSSTQEDGLIHVISYRSDPFSHPGPEPPPVVDEIVLDGTGRGPFEYQTGDLLRDSTYYLCAYLDIDANGSPDYVTAGDEYFVSEPFGCYGLESIDDPVAAAIELRDDTTGIDLTLFHPAGTGPPGNCTIMGNADYEGVEAIDLIYIGISPDIDEIAPDFRYITAIESPGPYTLGQLALGNYYMYCYAFTDTGRIFSYRDGNENGRLDAGDVMSLMQMGQTLVNIGITLSSGAPEPGPSSVGGVVSYDGAMETSTVFVGLYDAWPFGTPIYQTTIPAPGSYEFLEIQPGSYFAHAFMDVDDDSTEGSGDPAGSYDLGDDGTIDQFYVPPDSTVDGIDILLDDPSAGTIDISVSPGTNPVFSWDGDPIHGIIVMEADVWYPPWLWRTRCEEEIDCIYSPITFGDIPVGCVFLPHADSLETGKIYRVEVERLEPEGSGYRVFSP